MKFFRAFAVIAVVMTSVSCWAADDASPAGDEATFAQMLNDGVRLSQEGKPAEALSYFDKIIAGYEDAYKGGEAKLYAARWQTESTAYLLEAAAAGTPARVVSVTWAYAYFMKAYALLDLGRIDESKSLLERAITLSPHNAQFLAELGNIYQRQKNWPKALETFQAAEAAAREFSPEDAKTIELTRAMRGIGYVYIEQNRLDDAEKIYRQCLELDSKDARAMNELRYIQKLRAQAGSR